jgi:hypothetical protein
MLTAHWKAQLTDLKGQATLVKYPRWGQEEVFSLAAEMVVKSMELAEAAIADGETQV